MSIRLGGFPPVNAGEPSISVKMSQIGGAVSARVAVTQASSAKAVFNCTASPCQIAADARQCAHWFQIEYLAADGSVLAKSEPDLLVLQKDQEVRSEELSRFCAGLPLAGGQGVCIYQSRSQSRSLTHSVTSASISTAGSWPRLSVRPALRLNSIPLPQTPFLALATTSAFRFCIGLSSGSVMPKRHLPKSGWRPPSGGPRRRWRRGLHRLRGQPGRPRQRPLRGRLGPLSERRS